MGRIDVMPPPLVCQGYGEPCADADFGGLLESAYNFHEELDIQRLRELQVYPRGQSILIPKSVAPRMTGGDAKRANLRRTLDSLGLVRSVNQRIFHKAMEIAILPLLFGQEYSAEEARLLKEYGILRILSWVAIQTARREGKSTALVMFTIGVLWSIAFITQVGYSTGRRASMMNLENTVRMLQTLPGAKDRIIKCNHEQLWIRGPAGINDVRQLSWYPSREDIGNARSLLCFIFVVMMSGKKMDIFFYYFFLLGVLLFCNLPPFIPPSPSFIKERKKVVFLFVLRRKIDFISSFIY